MGCQDDYFVSAAASDSCLDCIHRRTPHLPRHFDGLGRCQPSVRCPVVDVSTHWVYDLRTCRDVGPQMHAVELRTQTGPSVSVSTILARPQGVPCLCETHPGDSQDESQLSPQVEQLGSA